MDRRKGRRTFDKEFKKGVVSLVTDKGRMVSELARDLDIHPNVIYRWRQEYPQDIEHAFPGKGYMLPAEEELRTLKKKLTDVTEERDILKKALAIFSQHPR